MSSTFKDDSPRSPLYLGINDTLNEITSSLPLTKKSLCRKVHSVMVDGMGKVKYVTFLILSNFTVDSIRNFLALISSNSKCSPQLDF